MDVENSTPIHWPIPYQIGLVSLLLGVVVKENDGGVSFFAGVCF
jgi:hypothetical protein